MTAHTGNASSKSGKPGMPKPAKARLGQNFLVSATAPAAIVAAMGDLSTASVLEIGPGHGVLTRLLASRSEHLTAVELDRAMAASLRLEFASQPQITILEGDILKLDPGRLPDEKPGRWRIVGNLPYYITSPILLHLFDHAAAIESAVLMVQREVAERVAASPGNRDYGLLSATAQMHARVEMLFSLPPSAFSPPPQVHSAVLRLTMEPRFAELQVERTPFLRFMRQAFAQKRKTLANNLRAAGYDTAKIKQALGTSLGSQQAAGDPLLARAEALSPEILARVFRAMGGSEAAQKLSGDAVS